MVDLLPSVRVINTENLCDTGLRQPDGNPVLLFSSQNEHVVATHFLWMKNYGIDGVATQRFVGGLPVLKKNRFDSVLESVRRSVEATRCVFYMAYDISEVDPKTVVADIRNDWHRMVDELKIAKSPSYLWGSTVIRCASY